MKLRTIVDIRKMNKLRYSAKLEITPEWGKRGNIFYPSGVIPHTLPNNVVFGIKIELQN